MKKVVILTLSLIIFVSILFFILNTKTKSTNITTLLLNAISVEHPSFLSVLEPGGLKAGQMLSGYDLRMTTLSLESDTKESFMEKINKGSQGYFSIAEDTTNVNQMHTVIFRPNASMETASDVLLSYILFASSMDNASDVGFSFEIKCMNKTKDGDSTFATLNCEEARSALSVMAQTINLFDSQALNAHVEQTMKHSQNQLEEARRAGEEASRKVQELLEKR